MLPAAPPPAPAPSPPPAVATPARRSVPVWAFALVAFLVALATVAALGVADALTGGGRLPFQLPVPASQPARR